MSIDEKQLLNYALNYLSIEGVRLVKLDKNTLHILVPKYHYMYNSEYTMYNIYNHKDFVDKIVKDVIHNVCGLKHLVINYETYDINWTLNMKFAMAKANRS